MLTLSEAEVMEITGYKRPSSQLAVLHRLGFSRARLNRLGRVVLERAHYDAVCAGRVAENATRPRVKPPALRPA